MTTADEQQAQSNDSNALSRAIAGVLKEQYPNATVQVTPAVIPPHIAGNLLEFLKRVQSTGMEAVAWVEAYQFVQQHVPQQPQQPQPGIPFGGLPAAPPK